MTHADALRIISLLVSIRLWLAVLVGVTIGVWLGSLLK